MLYSYIFKTETRIFLFFFVIQQHLSNFFVKINDIQKRISLKEPQFTVVIPI